MDGPLDLDRFLPYRLNRLAHLSSRQLAAAYRRRHAITVPEWRVLATLGQFGPLTATAIGAHAAMHKTKVSRAVAALEKRRWIDRAPRADDRREAELSLRPEGAAAYRDLARLARAFEEAIAATLTPEERRTVEEALALLEDRLAAVTGPPR